MPRVGGRTGGDDNGLLGALQPLDLLIKLGDAVILDQLC
jgi:hypothetical protein